MKLRLLTIILTLLTLVPAVHAQGWPSDYGGVMLQGFYWDSYSDTRWSQLEAQADEIGPYFQLVWVPQSGNCNTSGKVMGYKPVYYFNHNTCFGTEAQLRSMIAAFRRHGTGVVADVVINHRDNLGNGGSWADFPAETYRGETYQMLPSDVCGDDDGGQTGAWANKYGIQLGNDDTGEDWSGCRDLDHKSPNVQRCIKAYLDFLLNDLGYTGFRYDMVKGYYAYFIADYNMSARPAFSVGEYWSSSNDIKAWVNNSKGYVSSEPTSAAFDFQFRYRMRDAINNHDWRHLGYDDAPLAKDNYYKRWAVTFVENHDTERRSDATQDPIWADTLAANAYLMAMPGTPCVFYKHWQAYKQPIKQMILARRLAGITNTSSSTQKASAQSYYAVQINGSVGNLICVVGQSPASYSVSPSLYTPIISGPGYRYLLSRSANTVWMDKPDGCYDDAVDVTLTSISTSSTAKIVYTTDGSEPTAKSQQLTSGETLHLTSDCTLRAGLLVNGQVRGIQSRAYTIFRPHDITLYVRSEVTWPSMYFYAWDNNDKQLCGNWPGKRITSTTMVDGRRWYKQSFSLKQHDSYVNLVVANTGGSSQTVDVVGLNADSYLVITAEREGGKYVVQDVTADVATSVPALSPLLPPAFSERAFNLSGQPTAPHGLYIQGGKKLLRLQH